MDTEYRVLYFCGSHPLGALLGLEKEVGDYLNMGWRPVGGVSITGNTAIQAVTVEHTRITSTETQ